MGKWESGKNPYRTRAYTFPTKWESGKVKGVFGKVGKFDLHQVSFIGLKIIAESTCIPTTPTKRLYDAV